MCNLIPFYFTFVKPFTICRFTMYDLRADIYDFTIYNVRFTYRSGAAVNRKL
jgi:hypothetical protein